MKIQYLKFNHEKKDHCGWGPAKEVNKEQPSYRNFSATATRVLRVHAQLQLLGKIFQLFTPHLRLYTHKKYNKILQSPGRGPVQEGGAPGELRR
jgi:hypothetical protein